MSEDIIIALAQLNFTVGDIQGNFSKIEKIYAEQKSSCDLIIFPELSLIGYPAEDLVLREDFRDNAAKYLAQLVLLTKGQRASMLVGSIDELYNVVFLLQDGIIKSKIRKSILPNYGVFDEKRVFQSGNSASQIEIKGKKCQVIICEELWHDEYNIQKNNDLLIVVNASPFEVDKFDQRVGLAKNAIKKSNTPLIYLNLVGGQDSLVFDGASFCLTKNGNYSKLLKSFEEEVALVNFSKLDSEIEVSLPNKQEDIFNALVTGLRDYVRKNGFSKVLLGVSGGVDSALVACIAKYALGSENVLGVLLPSKFTSYESTKDANDLIINLKIKTDEIDILPIYDVCKKSINANSLVKQNLQARIRGLLLMAISNYDNSLLLSTGNKSELAVGYSTIYGDMCGAFNPIKDLYKTEVYELCEWINRDSEIIPANILIKAPTAELKDNQKDQDTLPEYDILDRILYLFIEEKCSLEKIIAEGLEPELVAKIIKMVKLAEYKRHQAPPGTKISKQNFGLDRRMPITNGFFK
jgi:NAD+ synthetase